MNYAGIDAGSRAIKAVLINGETKDIIASAVIDQGIHQESLAEELLKRLLSDANMKRADLGWIVATGYGRDALSFADKTVTEITCHAKGVFHLNPGAKTVIDIGGQDSKLLRLEKNGHVRDFVMNDRCAAGTGRFLEVVANRLQVSITELGDRASEADAPSSISSMCVVFAETEIIGLLAAGETPQNIIAGVQTSISSRIASMAGRGIDNPVVFTGGVALIPGMQTALEKTLNCYIKTSPRPQFTGALGAAIIAGGL